jgi:hypothetical protein
MLAYAIQRWLMVGLTLDLNYKSRAQKPGWYPRLGGNGTVGEYGPHP